MPTARFLHIGFNYSVPSEWVAKVQKLDPVVSANAEDWLRYAPNCWIVWTTKSPGEWYELLRHHMTNADSLLIFGLNVGDRQGWAAKWIWDWLEKSR